MPPQHMQRMRPSNFLASAPSLCPTLAGPSRRTPAALVPDTRSPHPHPHPRPVRRRRGGYAHWGMLESAEWFVRNELANVHAACAAHPGYGLVLVGHSLGAGTACLLAHWIRNDPDARWAPSPGGPPGHGVEGAWL